MLQTTHVDEIGQDKTLLIVDDDKPFLTRLARAMESRGFGVETAESVADGVSGKLVPPEDVGALTSAIIDLAQNPSERQRMGDRGHHIYSNRFRLEHMLEATAELYRRTLL